MPCAALKLLIACRYDFVADSLILTELFSFRCSTTVCVVLTKIGASIDPWFEQCWMSIFMESSRYCEFSLSLMLAVSFVLRFAICGGSICPPLVALDLCLICYFLANAAVYDNNDADDCTENWLSEYSLQSSASLLS